MHPVQPPQNPSPRQWRHILHEIIFEAETPAGKAFDVVLLIVILISILVVSLETVASIRAQYGAALWAAEWTITILFTIEYVLRIISVGRPMSYIFSFYGIVDLLSFLPSYLSLFIAGSQYLVVIRTLRLLRVFRILKLTRYVIGSRIITTALNASRPKIVVFLFAIVTFVLIIGSLMYLIEGQAAGFDNIPLSMYWAIVTLTTVGYGDIVPLTPLGKFLACVVMALGYSIIAVPTGIVSVEIAAASKEQFNTLSCPQCGREGHDPEATYCKFCASRL
jgi:voltage-gated potassium channel